MRFDQRRKKKGEKLPPNRSAPTKKGPPARELPTTARVLIAFLGKKEEKKEKRKKHESLSLD